MRSWVLRRNKGGKAIDTTVRADAAPAAHDARLTLHPTPSPRSTAELIAQRRNIGSFDPASLRAEVDTVVDQSL